MKHKLLDYVLIVLVALTCAAITPQALAEKTQGKSAKSTADKDSTQPGQLQITGTPGSAGATTTISGNQLPPPDPKFGGVIKERASESTPWWPPRVVPPKERAQRAADHDRR